MAALGAFELLVLLVVLVVCEAQCPSGGPGNGNCDMMPCMDPADTNFNSPSGCVCCSAADMATTAAPPTQAPTTPRVVTVPPATCVDKLNPRTGTSDCPFRSYLCNDAVYFNLMTDQCPRTCGRCSEGGGGTTPCVDKLNPSTGTSDCPFRTYLCNDSVYYNLMTDQCPATCGRCSG